MEFSILTTAGDYSSKLADWELDNAKAVRYIDFALLQAYNQIQSIYGLSDEQMATQFGADFKTTAVSQLSNAQRAQAISELTRRYLWQLAKSGRETMLANQKAAEQEDAVTDGDFGAVN